MRLRKKYASSILLNSATFLWRSAQLAFVVLIVFYGGNWIHEKWNTSSTFQVSRVELASSVPASLSTFLNIRPGENIFLVKTRLLEKKALANYPEFEDVRISRHWNRTIQVQVEYRQPIALMEKNEKYFGLDSEGNRFPIRENNKPTESIPMFGGPGWTDTSLKMWARSLSILKTHLPQFYSRINRLETDTMLTVKVELSDGVIVDWSRVVPELVVDQGEKILRILKKFDPIQKPATLKFVTADRIVMDKNWREKKVG